MHSFLHNFKAIQFYHIVLFGRLNGSYTIFRIGKIYIKLYIIMKQSDYS